MSNTLFIVLSLIARCSLGLCLVPSMETDWEYMLLKSDWNSTDEDMLKTDIRTVRVDRGVYALNGTLWIGVEIDDSFIFTFQLLYSSNGNGKWSNTPFEVKPTHFYKFMNTAYKEYLMEDVKRCAGGPHIGDEEYKEPYKPITLFAKNCLVNTDALPAHLRPGYYKMTIDVNGPPVHFYAEVTAKVNEKGS